MFEFIFIDPPFGIWLLVLCVAIYSSVQCRNIKGFNVCIRLIDCVLAKDFYIIWLSNRLTKSVSTYCNCKNGPCVNLRYVRVYCYCKNGPCVNLRYVRVYCNCKNGPCVNLRYVHVYYYKSNEWWKLFLLSLK